MKKVTDRRRAHRHFTESELIFFHRGIPAMARLLDLSLHGARLETTEPLRARTQITLVLSAPAQPSLTLTARVRFARTGNGTGVEFTTLTPHESRRLSSLMQALSLPT